jgi:UDP-N-acetylmuramoylalanine--D-glutamate ligase
MAFAIRKYQSDYSIFTNLKPDHLNWHTSLQGYMDAKMNLMKYTTIRSIVNEQVIQFAKENELYIEIPENARIFGDGHDTNDTTDGENIRVSGQQQYKLSQTHFSGVHNAMNILACTMIADELNLSSEDTKKHLKSITGLPHRLELIATK